MNEHGNSALHYACFWGYAGLAEDLVQAGALVGVQNKYQETPLDKAGGQLAARLQDSAARAGQDLKVGIKALEHRQHKLQGESKLDCPLLLPNRTLRPTNSSQGPERHL